MKSPSIEQTLTTLLPSLLNITRTEQAIEFMNGAAPWLKIGHQSKNIIHLDEKHFIRLCITCAYQKVKHSQHSETNLDDLYNSYADEILQLEAFVETSDIAQMLNIGGTVIDSASHKVEGKLFAINVFRVEIKDLCASLVLDEDNKQLHIHDTEYDCSLMRVAQSKDKKKLYLLDVYQANFVDYLVNIAANQIKDTKPEDSTFCEAIDDIVANFEEGLEKLAESFFPPLHTWIAQEITAEKLNDFCKAPLTALKKAIYTRDL